jgi:DNA mismatch repair protein MutS
LGELERRSAQTHAQRPQQELPLEQPTQLETHAALEALGKIDPDAMTPREALEAIYRLKALVKCVDR